MNYSVVLVQRGINSPTHPVTGISQKLYGHATLNPARGGVSFTMTLEDYLASMHDIVGNKGVNQQWVPEFEMGPALTVMNYGKCGIPAGCQLDAAYQWERAKFCEFHAPLNALPLYAGAPAIRPASELPSAATPEHAPDVQAPLVEKREAGVEREIMAPPMVGSAEEAATAPSTAPAPAVQAERPPPETTAPPKPVNVRDALAELVGIEVAKVVPVIVDQLKAHFADRPSQLPPKEVAPPTYKQLQARAKELGIDTYRDGKQKGKSDLVAEIADKEKAA